MLKILFIGDIVGKIGREAVKQILPHLKKELKPDLVIANAENLAHGKGMTKTTLEEIMPAGIDWFTSGDHAFDREKQLKEIIDNSLPLLRPANYSAGNPGQGYAEITIGKHQVLLINLIGRVFMHLDYDCPFRKLDEILLKFAEKKYSAIIIDMHAEATSEKIAMQNFADGRVSAVLGTHTHVMTADCAVTARGTARVTDAGMTGFAAGVIGIDKENIIKTFLTQIKYPHIIPEKGRAVFNAALISIDGKTGKAKEIKPIIEFLDIE